MNRSTRWVLIGAGIGTTIGSIVWFFGWLFTPAMVNTQVKSTDWTYTSELRVREIRHTNEWGRPGSKGFYQEPAFNVSCHTEYYGTEDCNPHDCMCSRSSDGRMSCSTCYDQCPEYRDRCEYDYYEWPVAQTAQTSGTGKETHWPDLAAKPPRQRLELSHVYKIVFSRESDVYEYNPETLQGYQQFSVGEYWRLQVGKIRTHNIENLKRLQAEQE
jgi:hypothetical protein